MSDKRRYNQGLYIVYDKTNTEFGNTMVLALRKWHGWYLLNDNHPIFKHGFITDDIFHKNFNVDMFFPSVPINNLKG
jgi:hypothetical protein